MQVRLERLALQNFKGCKDRIIDFTDRTNIYGANATGKTTVLDSFMWLLFDKDSTGATKFQVRPLDANGKQVDNVEIMVEGTLNVDGKCIVLKKAQRQKWVKKRGTDMTELQGNENLFEVNGYPKSEKDYKEYISDLVNEDLFKLITNPQTFVSLPWKKQREVLMRLVDDMSDVEIAQSDNKYSPLIPELEQASTDDIQKKYTKALNTWKKKQIEIPARIDELSKQLVDIDVAELELQANCLREQIADTEKLYDNSEASIKEYDRVTAEIMRVKGEMRIIFDKANHILNAEREAIQKRKDNAQNGFNEARQQIRMCELDIDRCKAAIERYENEKKQYQDEWRTEKVKVFYEYEELPELAADSLICPTCGQLLPEDLKQQKIADYEERKMAHLKKYEQDKQAFEQAKKNNLSRITDLGNATVAKIKEKNAELEQLEKRMEQLKADSMRCNREEYEATKELEKLSLQPDLSDNQEYDALQLELSGLEDGLKNMGTGATYRSQLKIKLSGLREELSAVEKKIVCSDNTAMEDRIAELKEEQLDVAQKVADQEKMIILLEAFIRTKMSRISEIINSKFEFTDFILFKNQINGGMSECCEARMGGVPYSALNAAGKVQVGLDIINTLQKIYGVQASIWIDNRESVTEIPEMDCQIISLYVSAKDKELAIC